MIQTAPNTSPAHRYPLASLPGVALSLLLLATAACTPSGSERGAWEDTGADQAYTVRGEVTATPGQSDLAADQIRIHHEAVPGFVGFDGEVVGMASMTMPFPAADTVDLDQLAVGDKIEFTFEVNWDASPGYRITRIKKLPPETELEFGRREELPGEKDVAETEPTPP